MFRTLTGTTIPGETEPGSYGNQIILFTPDTSRTRPSPPDAL